MGWLYAKRVNENRVALGLPRRCVLDVATDFPENRLVAIDWERQLCGCVAPRFLSQCLSKIIPAVAETVEPISTPSRTDR